MSMPIARAMGEQPNGRYAKSRNRPRINKQEVAQGSPTNPNANPYEPRGAAEALMYCKADEILLEGPAGTGKSRGALEKANLCAMKYARCRILLVRKTRASMTESVLVTFERKVLPVGTPMAQGIQRKLRQSYTYPNGSEIVVCGMDNPERIMSTEYDMMLAFEATELTEADWEMATSRLRNGIMPYQQAIADCNPGAPSHWLNKRAEKDNKRTGKKQMTRLLSRHQDNPMLWDIKMGDWTEAGRNYMARLDGLTGHRKLRLLDGKWAAAEGLVFDLYDAAIHTLSIDQLAAFQIAA